MLQLGEQQTGDYEGLSNHEFFSISDSLEDKLISIEESGSNPLFTQKERRGANKKPYYIDHFLNNIAFQLGSADRVIKRSGNSDQDLTRYCKDIMGLAYAIEGYSRSFSEQEISMDQLAENIKSVTDVLSEYIPSLEKKIGKNFPIHSITIKKGYHDLLMVTDLLTHSDKSDEAFAMIATMYSAIRNSRLPFADRLIPSFEDFTELSKNHYKSTLNGDSTFHIHSLNDNTQLWSRYLVAEETKNQGIFSLYVVDSTGIINQEDHADENTLDKAKRKNLTYFNKHPSMARDIDKNRKLLYFLEKELERDNIDISDINIIKGTTKYHFEKAGTVNRIDFLYQGQYNVLLMNGIEGSERLFRNNHGTCLPHYVLNILPKLKNDITEH